MRVDIREKICLSELLSGAQSAAITGHLHPDGDCVGSCLGLQSALNHLFPDLQTDVCLEPIPDTFGFLEGADRILTEPSEKAYDVVFCLDCNTPARLGKHAVLLEKAGKTVCIDHHIAGEPFADIDYIESTASSASELVCLLIGTDDLPKAACEALYMGIAHDTGVFQYSCTSSHTMNLAGQLMDKGINFSRIITKTFFEKTYLQQQLLGRTLFESVRVLDGRVIFSTLKRKDMDFFCAKTSDLEGLSAALRNTTGVEVSIFIHESRPGEWKVSLRSGEKVDVALVDSVASAMENITMIYQATGRIPQRIGNRYESTYPYDSFPALDGDVIVAAGNNKLFGILCDVMGQPELKTDPRFAEVKDRVENHEQVRELVSAWTSQHTIEEVDRLLNDAGCPASPVNTIDRMVVDPQIAGARNMFPEIDQPGIGKLHVTATAQKLTRTKSEPRKPAPLLGEDNAAIYGEYLGFDEAKLSELKAKGVI